MLHPEHSNHVEVATYQCKVDLHLHKVNTDKVLSATHSVTCWKVWRLWDCRAKGVNPKTIQPSLPHHPWTLEQCPKPPRAALHHPERATLMAAPAYQSTTQSRPVCLAAQDPSVKFCLTHAPICTPPSNLPKKNTALRATSKDTPQSFGQIGMHLGHKWLPRLLVSVALELRSSASLHGLSLAKSSARKSLR